MSTTPGRSLKIIVGGKRTVLVERASWGQYDLGDISVRGREQVDGTVFIEGIGWRLADVRQLGRGFFDKGEDASAVIRPGNANATLAIYSDSGDAIQEKPNQRALTELPGVSTGGQSTQGDYWMHADARQLGGLGSDWTSFPPPTMDEPVPLDRALVGSDLLDADDSFVFNFRTKGGTGSRNLGPLVRFYFPGIPGEKKEDGQAGTGVYSLTCFGDGIAMLYERLTGGTWVYRTMFRYSGQSSVIGASHTIRVTTDARRTGDDLVYGRIINFEFNTTGLIAGKGILETLANLTVSTIEQPATTFQTYSYVVPGATIANQPTKTKIRVDKRRDVSVVFSPVRQLFRETGKVLVKTFTLEDTPSAGVIHIQCFGHFPTGTGVNLRLFRASDGTEVTSAGVIVDERERYFEDFNVSPGDRAYRLVVEMSASTDRYYSPTLSVVAWVREAQFGTILSNETEVLNVTHVSTTGAGSDPSTETAGFVAWDLLGGQNAALLKTGQRVRIVQELGPDPENPEETLYTVLFKGILRQPKRKRVAGKGRKGFGGTDTLRSDSLSRYECTALGEWAWLAKRLAPGRYNIAQNRSAIAVGAGEPTRITDVVRDLLLAVLPKCRVHVPDIALPFPFDAGLPTFLEKYQPVLPLVVQLVRDYLGGYLVFDPNASYPEGDARGVCDVSPDGTTEEGMWRVMLAPKIADIKPVVEFCREPVNASAPVASPAAYPDATETVGEGEEATTRSYPRTFFRAGTTDEWPEAPLYNQVIVRALAKVPTPLTIGQAHAPTVVLNNWPTAQFNVERLPDLSLPPAQGEEGGPPAPDATHPDYTTGDIDTLFHSDPGITTVAGMQFIGRRLFDLYCHRKDWQSGEAPLVLLTPEVTEDALQVRPRPVRFGDIALVGGKKFVCAEQPSILGDGQQGGSRFTHGFYSMYSVPAASALIQGPRAAYSEMWV